MTRVDAEKINSRLPTALAHAQPIATLLPDGASLHSGNIVCLPGGGFDLIDIAGLTLLPGRLGLVRPVRNLRPLLRDSDLRAHWQVSQYLVFIDACCRSAGATPGQETRLRRLDRWQ